MQRGYRFIRGFRSRQAIRYPRSICELSVVSADLRNSRATYRVRFSSSTETRTKFHWFVEVILGGASNDGGHLRIPCSLCGRERDSGDILVGKHGAQAGSRSMYYSKQECYRRSIWCCDAVDVGIVRTFCVTVGHFSPFLFARGPNRHKMDPRCS